MSDDRNQSPNLSRPYRNHTITFSPADLKFHIEGPEFGQYSDPYKTFNSFDEARIRIDREVDGAAQLVAKNIKLGEILLDSNGNEVKITAIHRGTGNISGTDDRYLFPNLPHVRNLVKRRRQLITEIETADKELWKVRIERRRTYGRIDVSDYARKVDELKKEIAEKTTVAEQMIVPSSNLIELKKEGTQ